MPYELRKAGKGYVVVSKDTGKQHSAMPLPKDKAEAQMRALYSSMGREAKESHGNRPR